MAGATMQGKSASKRYIILFLSPGNRRHLHSSLWEISRYGILKYQRLRVSFPGCEPFQIHSVSRLWHKTMLAPRTASDMPDRFPAFILGLQSHYCGLSWVAPVTSKSIETTKCLQPYPHVPQQSWSREQWAMLPRDNRRIGIMAFGKVAVVLVRAQQHSGRLGLSAGTYLIS